MDEKTRAELDALLGHYDSARGELERKREAAKRQGEQDRTTYETAREVILPILDEFASALNERGHSAEVSSGPQSMLLKLTVRHLRVGPPNSAGLAFRLVGASIAADRSLTGRALREFTIPLSEVSRERVEGEVLLFLREALEHPWEA